MARGQDCHAATNRLLRLLMCSTAEPNAFKSAKAGYMGLPCSLPVWMLWTLMSTLYQLIAQDAQHNSAEQQLLSAVS